MNFFSKILETQARIHSKSSVKKVLTSAQSFFCRLTKMGSNGIFNNFYNCNALRVCGTCIYCAYCANSIQFSGKKEVNQNVRITVTIEATKGNKRCADAVTASV